MSKNYNKNQPNYPQGNRFLVSNRDMQSPYMQSYNAALQSGPLLGSPYEGTYDGRHVAADVGYSRKVKRNVFVIITAILLIVLLAFFVLSYLEMKKVDEYTSLAKIKLGPIAGHISLKRVVDGTIKSFKKDADEGLTGKGQVYFLDTIVEAKELNTVQKVSAYGLPIAIILFVLVLLVFLVRVVISVFTEKPRKFFVLSSLVLLLLGIAINAMFFLWNPEFKVADILKFFKEAFVSDDADVGVRAAIGSIVLIAVPLIALITSIFCFRKKREEEEDYYQDEYY